MNYIKIIFLALLLTLGIIFNTQSMDMENIRANYDKAASDRKLCQTMIDELRTRTESSLHLAYLGAFQTIWAKHVVNPISKLKTFNEGKKNIEDAVISAPGNIEIRLVRLSVQKNCSSFLGHNKNIEEDKKTFSPTIKMLNLIF